MLGSAVPSVIRSSFTLLRLAVGWMFMALLALPTLVVLVLLLPLRPLRVRLSSHYVRLVGGTCIRLSGMDVRLENRSGLETGRPAIYVSNHTSLLDVLLAMWLCPVGTTAVAKREVAWLPCIGQIYVLSGSLRIDRGDPERAIAALGRTAEFVRRAGLSVMIWPEGTRSRTGRLLPFKKGFAHLALQTRLPVVPIVVTGAHRAWRPNSLRFDDRARVTVHVARPIDTQAWSRDTLASHLAEVEAVFREHLPEDQQPSPATTPADHRTTA
jgi:lysophosphatidate acyltransferase